MNFLICIDIEKFSNSNNYHVNNLCKYINYHLPIAFSNNNINTCSLYFELNNKFYPNLDIENIYYYLNKNTFDINKIEQNHYLDLNKSFTHLILLTNKLRYDRNNLIKKLIDQIENVIILSLKTLSGDFSRNMIIKFDEVSKSTINYFTYKINLKDHNFTNNLTENLDKYIFEGKNLSNKVKQHYDYFLKLKKIRNLNGIEVDNYLLKKIINKPNRLNKTNLEIENNSDYDSEDYFKSIVSLSDYKQEILDNSFMGIMINCDKSIQKLIFIPKLINTNFIQDIISFNDFAEIFDNEVENYNKVYNENISNKKVDIKNISSQNSLINSFIPIYINKSHFNSIKNNLNRYFSKAFLGVDTNLDKRYYRIFYKILIDYVYYLDQKIENKQNILTDKDINLFLNYFRFCCEITKLLGYHKGINKYLESLSENYKSSSLSLDYLIGQLMCVGNLDKLQEYIKLSDNSYLKIIPEIINNIIKEFGSWKGFLNIFESNNGYFEDVLFIRNIKY